MKTLINKIKRNVILPLVVAGGIYNSCFSQTTTDSLIKYNQENKQVYEDFIQFVKEKGNMSEPGIFVINYDENPKEFCDSSLEIIFANKSKYLSLETHDSCLTTRLIIDHGANGLNQKEKDESKKPPKKIEYLFDKDGNIIKSTSYPNYKTFSEDAIGHAKEYTEILKKIMHDAGVSGY